MQIINISNLPPEVESLHKLIATLYDKNRELSEQNNSLSSKYQKISQEKAELLVNHNTLSKKCLELEFKNTELSDHIAILEEKLRLLKAKRFGKSSEKLDHQIDTVERQDRKSTRLNSSHRT